MGGTGDREEQWMLMGVKGRERGRGFRWWWAAEQEEREWYGRGGGERVLGFRGEE